MAGSLLYVNARIKSLENDLLNSMQISRLVDADNLNEAFKILQECGYGSGLAIEDYKSYEHLIANEERDAVEFLKENLFKNSGLEMFLLQNDYHNAKVFIKAKYLRIDDLDDMLAPAGLFELSNMKEQVFNDNYESLYIQMANALNVIDLAFAEGKRSPRLIDVELDKAMFSHIFSVAKASKQKPLIEYFVGWVDTTNIESFIRCRLLELEAEFFIDGFINNGSLAVELFLEYYDLALDNFKEKMKYNCYFDLVENLFEESGLVKYETAVSNFLLNIFKQNKYDMFSVAPIAGYYLGRITEIKAVKLIISCIKNNVNKVLLKQRLRELYA